MTWRLPGLSFPRGGLDIRGAAIPSLHTLDTPIQSAVFASHQRESLGCTGARLGLLSGSQDWRRSF
jgi:hypothetical protein